MSDDDSDENGTKNEKKKKRDERKSKLNFYEIMTAMILMSYSEDYNKIRMLFNLFDFDNNQGLDIDEFTLMVMLILESWGRTTMTQYTSR